MADILIAVGEPSGGARRRSILQHFGPVSYTQLTFGPVAAGDIVTAAQLGLKTIESVSVSDAADDGVHGVIAVLVGTEPTQVFLGWYTTITLAAQVNGAVNLSALSCRIDATGL